MMSSDKRNKQFFFDEFSHATHEYYENIICHILFNDSSHGTDWRSRRKTDGSIVLSQADAPERDLDKGDEDVTSGLAYGEWVHLGFSHH